MSFKWSEECQKFTMFEEGIDIFNKAGLFKISEDLDVNIDSQEKECNKCIAKDTENSSNLNQELRQDAQKTKAQQIEKEMREKYPSIQKYKTAEEYQQMMRSKMTEPQSWMQPHIVMKSTQ